MSVTALIPYYGGQSKAAPSDAANRPGYLLETIGSLRGFADRIIWASDADSHRFPNPGRDAELIQFDCEPRYIPANLMRWAQENAETDFVYVTEADQVLHIDPAVMSRATGTDYLVPHRLERLCGDGGRGRGEVVTDNGTEYVLANGSPSGDGFYHPGNSPWNFGGGFLAPRELFRSVTFADSPVFPVESATGHHIAAAGHALKTSDWKAFWVNHLSGYEYHERLAGVRNLLCPREF